MSIPIAYNCRYEESVSGTGDWCSNRTLADGR